VVLGLDQVLCRISNLGSGNYEQFATPGLPTNVRTEENQSFFGPKAVFISKGIISMEFISMAISMIKKECAFSAILLFKIFFISIGPRESGSLIESKKDLDYESAEGKAKKRQTSNTRIVTDQGIS
jgi:hypothetical protein